METNSKNPEEKEKDSPSPSPPILPQIAVRQSSELTRPMHMSFSDSDLELETSTSSSTEDGSSSPSGCIPRSVCYSYQNAIACLEREENNEVEEEELDEELEEELDEEVQDEEVQDEEVQEAEMKEEVPTLCSVHAVEREMFATALVVTRDIKATPNRLFCECARATAR